MTYLDGLRTALEAEHAALFVFGYLGGQTSQSADAGLFETMRATFEVHRARRDQLSVAVLDEGGEPVAAAAAYELPLVEYGDGAAIRRAALDLERACGSAYGFLVASAPSEHRRWAIDALLDSALRELAFDGRPRSGPGR